MKKIALISFAVACHSAPVPTPAVHATLLYGATQMYGVQPAGEDRGTVYGFVRIDVDRAATLRVTDIGLERGGVACTHATKLAVARIAPVTTATATRALTLAALASGASYDGVLAPGTTYLRVTAELDHVCGGQHGFPDLAIHLDDGDRLVRRVDEPLPS